MGPSSFFHTPRGNGALRGGQRVTHPSRVCPCAPHRSGAARAGPALALQRGERRPAAHPARVLRRGAAPHRAAGDAFSGLARCLTSPPVIPLLQGRGNIIVEYPGEPAGGIMSFVGCHLDVVTAVPDTWSFCESPPCTPPELGSPARQQGRPAQRAQGQSVRSFAVPRSQWLLRCPCPWVALCVAQRRLS